MALMKRQAQTTQTIKSRHDKLDEIDFRVTVREVTETATFPNDRSRPIPCLLRLNGVHTRGHLRLVICESLHPLAVITRESYISLNEGGVINLTPVRG